MNTTATIDSGSHWSVPIAAHEIPESGRRFDLVCDPATRAEIARSIGLQGLPRLTATFDVTRHGRDSLRVMGTVSATISQLCVLTLEPLENEVSEAVELIFSPSIGEPADVKHIATDDVEGFVDEGPEPLIDGRVDLGKIATEFLILGIDPYPRKPGAVFEPAATGEIPSPFAALAALKKKPGSDSDEA